MADLKTPGPHVDVVGIMKGIRESIQEKRARGYYSEEEIEELARARLRSYADEAFIDAKLLERLLSPSNDWNIASDYLIRSHRKGPLVPVILFLKRLVRPLIRLYTDHIVNRQAQLNLYYAYLLKHAIHDVTRLEIEVSALKGRLGEDPPPRPKG
jgi:hypothetical protein